MRLRLFFFFVIAGAGLVLIALDPSTILAMDERDSFGLLGFIAVGVLAEAMAIDFGKSQKSAKSSIAFLPFLSCTLLFPPAAAFVAVAAATAFSNFVIWRRKLSSSLFNIAQGALAAGFAGFVYSEIQPANVEVIDYVAFAALTTVFFATNMILSSTAIAIIRQEPWKRVFLQVIGPGGANLWYDLLASPIAIVAAILYLQYSISGILIIILPLLLIRYSYIAKVELQAANKDLLTVLVKAIETRDPYTSGHSLRVAILARNISLDMNLPQRIVDRIEHAALLHDIGKIDSSYSAIIQKPHSLSPEEHEVIKTHATKGADLLESLATVTKDVILAVRHHHERYDGGGYPQGLRGDEIPLAARIIMLSDSIDAMLSDRPYRSALPISQVESEIQRCSGSQFDPEIVAVVVKHQTLSRAIELVREITSSEWNTAISS